jgi:GT2 family glycosyltransferase
MSDAASNRTRADESPLLSIVIVSWNAQTDLHKCLRSLGRHTELVEYEVIVVDNASTDETVHMIRSTFPRVRVIDNAVNVGFARGCNQGMAASDAEFVLLLNADTYVEDNVIGRSVEVLRARPNIGMLGCRLAFPDGRLQHTANRSLSIRRSLFEGLWLYKLVPRARRAELLLDGYWDHGHEMEVDWLAGVFLLVRRSIYLDTEGFDEQFFMYGEDSEWCMRLRDAGHLILFTPVPGTVFHTGSVSSEVMWTEKERLRRCYVGGVGAYAAINGRAAAAGYRAAELLVSIVRLGVYSVIQAFRSHPYHAEQARLYRWRTEFYLRPAARPAQEADRGYH